MIAYYIHWSYPASADEELFYYGIDDSKFFHHEENAKKYAEKQLKQWQNDENRFFELEMKDSEKGLTPEEQEELRKLAPNIYGDLPNNYTIKEREMIFEDEE